MIVVVPPQAAARVPLSKVSEALVPPNGSSMWVWASMPPGMTYLPVASTTESTRPARSTPSTADPGTRTAAIVSPSTSTSATAVPVALTTVPPVIKVVVTGPAPSCAPRKLPTDCNKPALEPAVCWQFPQKVQWSWLGDGDVGVGTP